MKPIRSILRDPLIHFLLAGVVIYAAYAVWSEGQDPRSQDERTIVADRETLIEYMQYRSSAFEPESFAAQYDALPPPQRDALADAYIREEAMVREARALGLDTSDYVIRQRLMQKVLFLMDGAGSAQAEPSEVELAGWYATRKVDYARAPELTFTHVFVDDEKQRPGGGEAEAMRLLEKLNADGAQFNDAPAYGDRFAFLQNYVGREPDFIANQFGNGFAEQIGLLQPSTRWQGPFRSDYGWHLVLLTRREEGGVPELDEVRDQVLADYRSERMGAERAQSLDELLGQYVIVRDYAQGG